MKYVKKFENIESDNELRIMFEAELENWSGDKEITTDVVAEAYVLMKISSDKDSDIYKEKYEEVRNYLLTL